MQDFEVSSSLPVPLFGWNPKKRKSPSACDSLRAKTMGTCKQKER